MAKIRCDYCHTWVDASHYKAHISEHLRLRPDGQQNEYVTLPSEEAYQESIEDAPKVYRHPRCGFCTGMPEEIIRTYLKDPFAYMADQSYCSGCQSHIPCQELFWVETGENMQVYNDRLRRAYPRQGGVSRDFARGVTLISRLVIYGLIACLVAVAVIAWLWAKAGNTP